MSQGIGPDLTLGSRSLGLPLDPGRLWVSGVFGDRTVGQSASPEDGATADEEQGPKGAFVGGCSA